MLVAFQCLEELGVWWDAFPRGSRMNDMCCETRKVAMAWSIELECHFVDHLEDSEWASELTVCNHV